LATGSRALASRSKRYLLKCSKGSSLRMHEDDLGLLDVDATGSSDGYYVCAGPERNGVEAGQG